jgi:hypothetical protein
MSDVVGSTGTIITSTRGSDGPGEVETDRHGCYIAWSKNPLPRGTYVLIISARGTRAVSVEPFET